ncbi:SWIM zinc finger family protein [Paenibacillus sp. NPDC056579]|uniref:SWIM zinc finger family protein n=1 Tax=Paenibacillus sp. NPDC056579 TaxID=3345871 RepID=UPI0036BC3394
MSVFAALNDEQWSELLEQVASAFNEVTLSRGFNYFKQQYVVKLSASEDRVIQARVTGTEDYSVTLNLNKFKSSYCTCPVQTYCKHLAAVLMELADRLGYPATQIVNAKQHVKRTASAPKPGPGSESAIKGLPGKDIAGWHEYLEQATAYIRPPNDQGIYADMLKHRLQMIRKNSASFSEVDWIFFELHQMLFILYKMNNGGVQSSASFFTSFALHRMYDDIQTWLKQKSAQLLFTHSKERLEQTLSYVRQRMAEETGQTYLDYGLYTSLWKHWIASSPDADDWASREIGEMEKVPSGSMSASLAAAKAFLYLHQSQSKEAWAAVEAIGPINKLQPSLLLPFLNQLAGSRSWDGLADWLTRTSAAFYGRNSSELGAYMGYWRAAIEHAPDAEPAMWDALEEMMPHSIRIIEDLLYEQHKWKPWLEMQMVQGHDPLYHRVSVLQPIEKEAPELLLPYYHQAIEHYVTQKNRHDYKLAVKLLKRLEKVYKKLKQTERWDFFLAGFSIRNSRLRALQEELKKGKLLQ